MIKKKKDHEVTTQQEGKEPKATTKNAKTVKNVSKTSNSNTEKVRREFEEVKKEVDSIISKFKPTKLSKILGIYSEMEGIEFSWNN